MTGEESFSDVRPGIMTSSTSGSVCSGPVPVDLRSPLVGPAAVDLICPLGPVDWVTADWDTFPVDIEALVVTLAAGGDGDGGNGGAGGEGGPRSDGLRDPGADGPLILGLLSGPRREGGPPADSRELGSGGSVTVGSGPAVELIGAPRNRNVHLSLSIIRKYLTKNAAITIYKSMILPYFDYGDGFVINANQQLLDKIQRIQNRGLKICLGVEATTTTSDAHRSSKVARLAEVNIRERDAKVFKVFIPKSDAYKRSVLYKGAVEWNKLRLVT